MTTTVRTTSSGALQQLEVDGLSLLLYPATELESGPANLWLRRREDGRVQELRPLTGPASQGESFQHQGLTAVRGELAGVRHTTWFDAEDPGVLGWRWSLDNIGTEPVELDLVCTLDVALTPVADLRRSEYYVSQYLDLTPVEVPAPHGQTSTALAVRQNMPGERQPWAALGSSEPVVGWATDALQLLDRARGEGLDLSVELPSERLQHEHTLAALQTAPIRLAPGERQEGQFWIITVPDHPHATGVQDVALLTERLATRIWSSCPEPRQTAPVVPTVFCPARPAGVHDFPGEPAGLTSEERTTDGCLLSGFVGSEHVVTAAKEREVLRPHGKILHLSPGPEADGRALASTAWMSGVFASQLTSGPASSGELLGIRRSYLGLCEAAGLRLLVRRGGSTWRLLTTPSLWRTRDEHCTWLYRLDGDLDGSTVTVDVELTGTQELRLDVRVEGQPLDLLLVLDETNPGLSLDVTAGQLGDDGPLFADGGSRGLSTRTVQLDQATAASVRLLLPGGSDASRTHHWRLPSLDPSSVADQGETSALAHFISALAHDAAVHYQAPRGLEQYTGGAWGVRDVCQGPVGLLLATDEQQALRRTLVQIFAGQQDDGDWPQWFHFLPQMAGPGHRESHGDVVYWPLLALAEYLAVTGDAGILDECTALVGRDEVLAPVPLRQHVRLAVDRITAQRTRDPRLPAYGHGDWNDSLQPARPELAHQMCSTWTTELEIQALSLLAEQLRGPWPELSNELDELVAGTRQAFEEVLLVDDELAGYVVLSEDEPEVLVHPRDERTGLHHGLLQMIHAISDELLSPEQALHHQALISQHLSGPTGSYLFDRPVAYTGGTMTVFKRAEAATFWGREIGLMYTHAHVRHVEALSHLGMAEQMWHELLKVVPAALVERVEGAALRQNNCYYSSSDAWFTDRYQASHQADDLFSPSTRFEGGWRVYSSGPGLVLRLVVEKVLGVRRRAAGLEIDPVLPSQLDGLRAVVHVEGHELHLTYRVRGAGHGVREVRHQGRPLATRPLSSRYREAGVALVDPLAAIAGGVNVVELEVLVGG
ncbi:hypothetical protein [Luteococcus peritonei]|uniref:Cellobiose phosphorylase n=1 Tax=Luteococcus peritonei TaxID=88874 RepID=A0ABW4RV94_9ACTN